MHASGSMPRGPVYEWVAPSAWRRTIVGTLLGAPLVAAAFGYLAWRDQRLELGLVAGVALAVAALCWGTLMSTPPNMVSVVGSLISLRRRGRSETFDLVDPNLELRVRDGEIALTHYDGRWVVVKAREVDWSVFMDVVMRYQSHADRKAVERTRRFAS